MKARNLLATAAGVLLVGAAGCASTTKTMPLGSSYTDMDVPSKTQYCRPGSAIIYEIAGTKLLPPARPYDGGTCQ